MNKINNNEYLTDLTRRIQNMTITFSPIIDHSYNLGSLIFLMIIDYHIIIMQYALFIILIVIINNKVIDMLSS